MAKITAPSVKAAPPPPAEVAKEPPQKEIARLLFDARWYIDRHPEAPVDHEEAYRSYIEDGRMIGHQPSSLFANLRVPARATLPPQHLFRVTTSPILCRVPPTRYLELYRPQKKRGVSRPSSTLAEYLRRAMIRPDLIGPDLSEYDLRIAAYMDGLKNRLAAEYAQTSQDDLISVVLIASDNTGMLADTLASVVMQSYEHWELIIANTGGNPDFESIVRQFNDSRITIIQIESERGLGQARNACLERAAGSVIAYIDDNSLWDPDCLLVLRNRLRASGARAVYAALALWEGFDPDARLGAGFRAIRFSPFNRSLIENQDYLSTTVLVHDRALLDEVGRFDTSLRSHLDWDWITRLTETTRPDAVPCVLGHHFQRRPSEDVAAGEHDEETALCEIRARLVGRSDWLQPFMTSDGSEHVGFAVSRTTRDIRKAKLVALPIEPVRILIPNYESLNELEMCLASIAEHTSSPYEVLVIDNGSPDETYARLENMISSFERVRLIREDTAAGFSFAVNRGLSEIADGNEKILILNNDTLVTPAWLDELRYVLFKHADAGMAVPRQVLPAGSKAAKLHMPAANPHFECDINLSTQHDNVLDPEFDREDDIVELGFAPLFCGLIRPETIRALGGLDSGNGPHYRSDWILCEAIQRVLKQRILYTPHSKVYHLQGVATRQRNALTQPSPASSYAANRAAEEWANSRTR